MWWELAPYRCRTSAKRGVCFSTPTPLFFLRNRLTSLHSHGEPLTTMASDDLVWSVIGTDFVSLNYFFIDSRMAWC